MGLCWLCWTMTKLFLKACVMVCSCRLLFQSDGGLQVVKSNAMFLALGCSVSFALRNWISFRYRLWRWLLLWGLFACCFVDLKWSRLALNACVGWRYGIVGVWSVSCVWSVLHCMLAFPGGHLYMLCYNWQLASEMVGFMGSNPLSNGQVYGLIFKSIAFTIMLIHSNKV